MSLPDPPKAVDWLEVREVGDEVVVHDRHTEKIHVLNATAGRVLGTFDGRHSLDEIALDLGRGTGVEPARVRDDVERIVATFVQLGVIEPVRPA